MPEDDVISWNTNPWLDLKEAAELARLMEIKWGRAAGERKGT